MPGSVVVPSGTLIVKPVVGSLRSTIFAAAAGPPEEIEEWGEPIGEVKNADKTEEIDLHLGSAAKYFLVWFTKASPAGDQEGSFQVEISDIKLSE